MGEEVLPTASPFALKALGGEQKRYPSLRMSMRKRDEKKGMKRLLLGQMCDARFSA